MYKQLFLAFVLLFSNISSAQVNEDSLWSIWNDKSISDTLRFNAMTDLSWNEIMYNRMDSSFKLAELLINEARVNGMDKYESIYYHRKGYYNHHFGEYNEAESNFNKSLEIAEKYNMNKIKAQSLMGLADTYAVINDYDKALVYYTQASEYADEIGYEFLKYLSIANRGIVNRKMTRNEEALKDYEQSLAFYASSDNHMTHAAMLVLLGNYYRDLDQYAKALGYYEKGEILARQTNHEILLAEALGAIGRLHDKQENYKKGLEYKLQYLDLWLKLGNKNGIMWAYNNVAMSYRHLAEYDESLKYYDLNLQYAKELGSTLGEGYAFSGKGAVYYLMGEFEKALEFHKLELKIEEKSNRKSGIAIASQYLGAAYQALGDSRKAIVLCQKSYNYFTSTTMIERLKRSCQCLYEAHKSLNQPEKALFYFEQVASINDSLNVQEIGKKMQQLEFDKQLVADSLADVEEALRIDMAHSEEINKKNQTRNILMGSGLFILLLAAGLWNRLIYTRKSKNEISKEKDRSEELLLNILPAEVAQELKENGKAEAKNYDMVSILFSDFKSFTSISEQMNAKELVAEIGICFEAFDRIIDTFKIEKIKTIGDAYMAVGGLPVPYKESHKNTILAAIEMQSFISKRKEERDKIGLRAFEMRVGIHTGPVVAGIVGIKKFQYDIWGDTVNTASRMESNSNVGQINISQTTYELLKDDQELKFEKRGEFEVKGKGSMNMYFVRKA